MLAIAPIQEKLEAKPLRLRRVGKEQLQPMPCSRPLALCDQDLVNLIGLREHPTQSLAGRASVYTT